MFNSSDIKMLDIWQTFIRHLQTKGHQFVNLVAALVFLNKNVLKCRCSEFLKTIIFARRFKEYQMK